MERCGHEQQLRPFTTYISDWLIDHVDGAEFRRLDSSDEEVEQHIEVQKSEAKQIIEKIENVKKNVEGEPQGRRGGRYCD